MTREEEMKIVRMVLDGDTNAFEELVLAYQTRVYNIALRMTGSEEDACDLSQEVFLKAYRSLNTFRGESSVGSWLYRMAANMSIDHLRRRKRRQNELSLSPEGGEEDSRPLELPDLSLEPQTMLEQKELRAAVLGGLDRLPEEQRLILVMREVNGLSYQEISQALRIELGTVKSRIFRARASLAKTLLEDRNFLDRAASNKGKRR